MTHPIVRYERYECDDGVHSASLFSLNGEVGWTVYIYVNGACLEGRTYLYKSGAIKFMKSYAAPHEWKLREDDHQ